MELPFSLTKLVVCSLISFLCFVCSLVEAALSQLGRLVAYLKVTQDSSLLHATNEVGMPKIRATLPGCKAAFGEVIPLPIGSQHGAKLCYCQCVLAPSSYWCTVSQLRMRLVGTSELAGSQFKHYYCYALPCSHASPLQLDCVLTLRSFCHHSA